VTIRDIPVQVIGPGSQPGAGSDAPLYIDMPSDMEKYDAPLIPEPDEVQHLEGAREAMSWLEKALDVFQNSTEVQLANLNQLDEENRELVNQILGEGEVSITCDGSPQAKVQESVLAGVWRTLYFDDDDRVAMDLLEVAPVPHVAYTRDEKMRPVNTALPVGTQDISNAMPILVELEEHCVRFDQAGTEHSINLTLLPLSEEEIEFLDARLGRGPVDMLSRAYGKCQVIGTLTPNVWWVRYYNSMGTLILNSLEVTSMPQVVAAAAEDLGDSATRLREILAPYWSDVA
jgi:hydrogenase-1 operon protein HyaF